MPSRYKIHLTGSFHFNFFLRWYRDTVFDKQVEVPKASQQVSLARVDNTAAGQTDDRRLQSIGSATMDPVC